MKDEIELLKEIYKYLDEKIQKGEFKYIEFNFAGFAVVLGNDKDGAILMCFPFKGKESALAALELCFESYGNQTISRIYS